MSKPKNSKPAKRETGKTGRRVGAKKASPRTGASRRESRIITFYSYKGGTGRTMALANVAWILASVGRRVLVIDWDLEAPGLHHYFRPFLSDPDLERTPGMIDFFAEFAEAARREAQDGEAGAQGHSEETWYVPLTKLHRYALPIDYAFKPLPGHKEAGRIDLIPAGRQGASYRVLIDSSDWNSFYKDLGGGIFLGGSQGGTAQAL